MRKQKAVAFGTGITLVIGCTLALAGFSAQVDPSTAFADSGAPASVRTGYAEWQTDPDMDPSGFQEAIYAGFDERAQEFPVEVITYDDGVSVQRTPAPTRDSTANVKDYISWNTYRLHADERGCQSCHDDMGALVQSIPGAPHCDIDSLGIEITVKQCLDCHDTHLGGRYESQFSGLIHGIHVGSGVFDAQGGNCFSCHYGMMSGDDEGMALWDVVKHRVLRGITTIDASQVEGEFTFDQDVIESAEEGFSYNYIGGRREPVSSERFGRNYLGLTPDPATDGVYDEWYITIGGEVSNPVTMSLAELIEAVPSETRILQYQCANNRGGGTYVTNQEVTGISVKALMEYVGVTDGAMSLMAISADGKKGSAPLDWVEETDAYLVYQISGEPLSYEGGYPVQLWVPGMVADPYVKAVSDVDFSTDEYVEPVFMVNMAKVEVDGVSKHANAALCNLREGQIIPVGEPFTFEGYATCIAHAISAVEFSFDHGKTWVTCETPDNDFTRWTWWNFTWTPDTVGCYCIMVRAVDDQGLVTMSPHEVMVNVQDLSEE